MPSFLGLKMTKMTPVRDDENFHAPADRLTPISSQSNPKNEAIFEIPLRDSYDSIFSSSTNGGESQNSPTGRIRSPKNHAHDIQSLGSQMSINDMKNEFVDTISTSTTSSPDSDDHGEPNPFQGRFLIALEIP